MYKQTILNKFDKLIIQALNNVDQAYYKLKTTYDNTGIVRERVFCYELHHQFRLIQESLKLFDYTIHGEIDKSGHNLFDKDDQKNPDFVFHQAGTMKKNLIVIEVKGKLEEVGIKKDIDTLSKFCNLYKYNRGYWLVYNYDYDEILKSKISFDMINQPSDNLTLICKKSEDHEAEVIRFSKLIEDLGKKQ